jgi:hypothetical protein
MKKLKYIVTILFFSAILSGMTSCEVQRHAENGRHRGWFQNHDRDENRRGTVIVIEKNKREQRSDDDHDH